MVISKLHRIVRSLPPNWEALGLEPARGKGLRCSIKDGVAVNNTSTKAIAAAIYAVQVSHDAPERPMEGVETESRERFDVAVTSFERAKTVLENATLTQISDAFSGKVSHYTVFEKNHLKYPDSSAIVPIHNRGQLIEEFFNLLSLSSLSKAYKASAAAYSIDRPGQGDAAKSSRLNVLWGEIKKFKE